jgi:hypothetical protein
MYGKVLSLWEHSSWDFNGFTFFLFSGMTSLCTCNSWTDIIHPLSPFSLFWRNTIKEDLWNHLVCVCVYASLPTKEILNSWTNLYETWETWHLSPSQWHTSRTVPSVLSNTAASQVVELITLINKYYLNSWIGGYVQLLSKWQKSKCFETVYDWSGNNNMFLKQAASVIIPSHEVSFPYTMEVLAYLFTSVVAGQCDVFTPA